MISYQTVKSQIHNLREEELSLWISAELIHAEGPPGDWRFQDIDVARIRLIVELRHELEIEEQSLPIVLSLVDQIYDLRRRMTRLNAALADVPEDIRSTLRDKL